MKSGIGGTNRTLGRRWKEPLKVTCRRWLRLRPWWTRRLGVYSCAMSKRTIASGALCITLTLAALTPPRPVEAQTRYGLSLGGASTVALIVERRWDHQGLELQVGTWAFRDLSVSVTGKQYIGSNDAAPFIGAGLWSMVAFSEEGTGLGLIGRIPLGLDYTFSGPHSAALTIYMNRALALRRPDPEDQRPPRTALIPLPEFSYRWLNR